MRTFWNKFFSVYGTHAGLPYFGLILDAKCLPSLIFSFTHITQLAVILSGTTEHFFDALEQFQPPQSDPVAVVQPTGKFPPLPAKRSQKEFRHLVHWITRVQLVPFRKGTVRQSASGKSRYEYEAPSTHSKQAAMKQFRIA